MEKYVSELRFNVDKRRLKLALEEKTSSDRIGLIAYIFHDAVVRSSAAMFQGLPYWYNGQYYVPLSLDEFETAIYDAMRVLKVPSGDIVSRGQRIYQICEQAVYKKELTVYKNLVCFKNCILNVETGEKYTFNKRRHVVYQLPYDYDPTAKPDLWMKFLERVLPDEDARKVFQEYLGLLFVDRRKVKIETMLFLLGSGSNGKSVVFETVTGILGRENVANFELSALTHGGDRLKNIAAINDKVVNYCSEISRNEINSAYAKAIISGEPQQARKMFGQPFTAYNIPLMIANANEMPFTQDTTHGFYRRVLIIPFNVEIPEAEQDKELARKLAEEYPAIFNWILEGTRRIAANAYQFSAAMSITEALMDYKHSSNPILRWIADSGYSATPTGTAIVWKNAFDLYHLEYVKYADRYALDRTTVRIFGNTLRSCKFPKRRTINGNQWGVYIKQKV